MHILQERNQTHTGQKYTQFCYPSMHINAFTDLATPKIIFFEEAQRGRYHRLLTVDYGKAVWDRHNRF